MNVILPRRRVLLCGMAAGLTLAGLPARACELFSPTLRLTHPWTRATPDEASSAVICMRFDEVQQDDRLIAIETPVASGAEMGGPEARADINLFIPRGRETILSEHGTHIRLTGLNQALEVGRTYPMRLRFEVGGVLRAELSVDYARFR